MVPSLPCVIIYYLDGWLLFPEGQTRSSRGKVKLHEIEQFYGERKGWRMFDSHTLTLEIESYLRAEAVFLGKTMGAGYKTLIEVGCGYGRYLDWALSRGYSYVGLDIVPWLVELGQMRVTRARSRYPGARCAIYRHPAESIARATREYCPDLNEHNALAFFPFNCLGNVARFDTVIDSLKASRLDLVVSTFKTDAVATRIRKDYYGKCGYEQLNSRIMKQGLLIISEEGFHAMAYHREFLVNALKKRGFDLRWQEQAESVGSIYYFSFNKEHGAEKAAEVNAGNSNNGIDACVHAVEKDPLANSQRNLESGGELLSFKEMSMNCRLVSADHILALSAHSVESGTTVRLVVPVIPQNRSAIEGHLWYTDLVGEVESCGEKTEGQFEIVIKLSKPEPDLIDRLACGKNRN